MTRSYEEGKAAARGRPQDEKPHHLYTDPKNTERSDPAASSSP